jgi:hypothetical protein
MNIKTLLRELSGPRPLRWAVGIASKPRICNPGAKSVSLEAHPTYQVTGSGRTPNLPKSRPLDTGVAPVLECSIPPTYATQKTWDIEE